MSVDIRDEIARDTLDTPPNGYGEWDDVVDAVHNHLKADLACLKKLGLEVTDYDQDGTLYIAGWRLPTLASLYRPWMTLNNGVEVYDLGPFPSLRSELADQLEAAAKVLRGEKP